MTEQRLLVMLKRMREEFVVPDGFAQASAEEYLCRCQNCLDYWVDAGPTSNDVGGQFGEGFGPFLATEIEARRKERGLIASPAVKKAIDEHERR